MRENPYLDPTQFAVQNQTSAELNEQLAGRLIKSAKACFKKTTRVVVFLRLLIDNLRGARHWSEVPLKRRWRRNAAGNSLGVRHHV
jgi:hypothetical protein